MVTTEPADNTAPFLHAAVHKTFQINKRALRSGVAGCLLLLLSLVLYLVNPVLLIAKHATRISKGSEFYQILEREMDTVYISVYLFNLTNSAEFLAGTDSKLKVNEIGPFVYREVRINKDLKLDPSRNIMYYVPSTNITLMRELSIADPKEINVTMPNVALLTMSSLVSHQSFWMKAPFNILTAKEKSKAIVQMSAESYLWGYDEPLITLGNTFLPGWIYFKTLGLLDRLLDRERPSAIEIDTTHLSKFQVKTVNGLGGFPQWGYGVKNSDCNTFTDAYEGLGYPTNITPNTRIRIYRKILCRLLDMDFIGTVTTDYGVTAFKYQIGNKTYDFSGKNQCLCAKGSCFKGQYDISACLYGVPLSMSQPHFLDADLKLSEQIEGLKPNPTLHTSEVLVEPTSGLGLSNRIAVQVNVDVADVMFNSAAKRFANKVVPIAWFKAEMPALKKELIYNLQWINNYGPKVCFTVQILLIVSGMFLIGWSTSHVFWNQFKERIRISYNSVPTCDKDMKLITSNKSKKTSPTLR